LEHEPDPPDSKIPSPRIVEAPKSFTGHVDAAESGGCDPGDQVQKRGLPRTAGADDADAISALDDKEGTLSSKSPLG